MADFTPGIRAVGGAGGGAELEGHGEPEEVALAGREVRGGWNFFAQRAVFRVFDDADDLNRFAQLVAVHCAITLANGILAGEKFLRQGFIHDRHMRRLGRVVGIEVAAR